MRALDGTWVGVLPDDGERDASGHRCSIKLATPYFFSGKSRFSSEFENGNFFRSLMSRLIVILEQNAVDASLLERCFLEERVCNPARVLRTPERLRCYLEGVGSYRNRELYPLPTLLLLNLDYVRAAFEVLAWLRQGNYLEKFPVFGIGNLVDSDVLQRAFDSGLNAFFEKPTEMSQLSKLICKLQWIDSAAPQVPADLGVKILTREKLAFRDQA